MLFYFVVVGGYIDVMDEFLECGVDIDVCMRGGCGCECFFWIGFVLS